MTVEGENTIDQDTGAAGGEEVVDQNAGGTLLGSTPEGEPSADDVKGETGNSDEPKATEGDGPKGEGENAGEEGEEGAEKPAELKLEVPEGLDVPEDRLERFKAFATEKGLSQEHAQAILDNALEESKAEAEALKQQREQWREEFKKDPDWQKLAGDAKAAVKRFADEETASLLTETYLGDHPGVLRFLAKVGKATAEDAFHDGRGAPPKAEIPFAKRMFPNG